MTRRFPPNSRTALARASLVSVSALIWGTQALAETPVSTARTTPIATSTAASGAPDDVRIAPEGSIKFNSAGAAVTQDSNNAATNAGTIEIKDSSDATGILSSGGRTGAITNAGVITINETATPTDTDSDGDLDGPLANGARRFGIRVTGPGAFSGPILSNAAGTINIQGDDSAGISVETNLVGNLTVEGALNVVGSRNFAVRTTGTVSGDVRIAGAVTAVGQATQGVVLGGDIGGRLVVQGGVTVTGYRFTTRSPDPTANARLDADDMLQSGSALTVAGNVARGLLLDTPPADIDAANTDEDADGIIDSAEGSGVVSVFGGAPAVVVGAAGRSVALGNVGAGLDAFGVVVKGGVAGDGVYDGVTAQALQLGVAGGGAVTTGGGVRNTGAITATAALADSTGIALNSGVSAPTIRNEGTIAAASSGETVVAARAISIAPGASVSLLQNGGTISASLAGEKGEAVAILDRSGTLGYIENSRVISAVLTPTDDANDTDDADNLPGNEVITGRATAIDVTANTRGVVISQRDLSGGTVIPAIVGAIRMGSGADRLEVLAGNVIGDIAFGAGANVMTIDGGATVTGGLTAQGGTLALSVGTGTLQINSVERIPLTSLGLGAASKLILSVDPATNTASLLDVAGAANIATGAKIGVRLTSLLKTTGTYTLIRANSLTAGVIDQSLLAQTAFLYKASLSSNPAAGLVTVTLARKTAAELRLPAATAGAYESVILAADRDARLRDALLAQTDRTGVLGVYNQLLPEHSGAIFHALTTASDATGRAIDERQGEGGGAWVQEINYRLEGDGGVDVPGYYAWGFGLVGAFEREVSAAGIVGLTLGLSTNQIENDAVSANSNLTTTLLEGGAYWRGTWGGFSANARAAGSYMRAKSLRVVTISNTAGSFTGQSEGRWSGFAGVARVHISYEANIGRLYARPHLAVDYVRLAEGDYDETRGGVGLDLAVDRRVSSRLSGFAGVKLGAVFGLEQSWGPELVVGYRSVASETLDGATARFLSGGPSFTLAADEVGGSGLLGRLAVKGENGSGGFAVEGGTEKRDELTIYDLRLAAHFQF